MSSAGPKVLQACNNRDAGKWHLQLTQVRDTPAAARQGLHKVTGLTGWKLLMVVPRSDAACCSERPTGATWLLTAALVMHSPTWQQL